VECNEFFGDAFRSFFRKQVACTSHRNPCSTGNFARHSPSVGDVVHSIVGAPHDERRWWRRANDVPRGLDCDRIDRSREVHESASGAWLAQLLDVTVERPYAGCVTATADQRREHSLSKPRDDG
jgi:hypothetical protein